LDGGVASTWTVPGRLSKSIFARLKERALGRVTVAVRCTTRTITWHPPTSDLGVAGMGTFVRPVTVRM
jgi:hypothetical protein